MITDLGQGKHYLYRHIRLDKREVFYIGIGTKGKDDLKYGYYKRAATDNRRGPIWHNIISKTNWEYEIILESDDYDFIKKKEKEFIKLYGRKDLKTGVLANMTDGGDGTKNVIVSARARELRRINMKGRVIKKESVEKALLTKKLRQEAGVIYNFGTKGVNAKPVCQFNLNGDLVKTYSSALEAAEQNNIWVGGVRRAAAHIKFNNIVYENSIWIYKKEIEDNDTKIIFPLLRKLFLGTGKKGPSYSIEFKKEIVDMYHEVKNRFSTLTEINAYIGELKNIPARTVNYFIYRGAKILEEYENSKTKAEQLIKKIWSLN